MVAAIAAIIVAIIGYFTSKKGGATNAQAAMVGAAAGAGTYYVATQTEWGQDMIGRIENWVGVTDGAGQPVLDDAGDPVKIPEGAELVLDEDGNPQKNPDGSIAWKLIDSAGNVLTNWGPQGTAAVVGTTGVVAALSDSPWLLVAAAVAVVAVLS